MKFLSSFDELVILAKNILNSKENNMVEIDVDQLKMLWNGGGNMNFSLDEKVVGTWIDGKPLYQKTIVLENIALGSQNKVSHGIINMDIFFIVNAFIVNDNYRDSGKIGSVSAFNDISNMIITEDEFHFYGSSDSTHIGKLYATVAYTKITN